MPRAQIMATKETELQSSEEAPGLEEALCRLKEKEKESRTWSFACAL
jgi:hypothetical protein